MQSHKTYWRAARNPDGTGFRPWYLFANSPDHIKTGLYGNYIFTATDDGATDAKELIPLIAETLWAKGQHFLKEELTEQNAIAIAHAANLPDIVNSAGLWDYPDLVEFVQKNVLQPRYIKKVKTVDGLVLFSKEDMLFVGERKDWLDVIAESSFLIEDLTK